MISLARHNAAVDPLMPSDAQVTLLRLVKAYTGLSPLAVTPACSSVDTLHISLSIICGHCCTAHYATVSTGSAPGVCKLLAQACGCLSHLQLVD